MRSNSLIDRHLSGKSAKYLIDEVLAEQPSTESVCQSLLRGLSKGNSARVTGETEITICTENNKQAAVFHISLFEQAYPEIDFIFE